MPFVFLASQCRRRLPSDPTSRGRPCLGLVVSFMYACAHEGKPPTGDLHPHTHAHAGRTPSRARDRRPVADWDELGRTRLGGGPRRVAFGGPETLQVYRVRRVTELEKSNEERASRSLQ